MASIYGEMSAVKLIKEIKEKRVSSLELLEYFIGRTQHLNPGINAIVATDFDAARRQAKKADAALARGEDTGPLHGLPMTVKDNFELVGMPTTYGSLDYKDYMPDQNADVVQSLLDAGAVIFGKTNLPLLGMDTQSFNDVYGRTNNPWDLSRTPGGSSGGAGAALAAGLTGLEMGNDIGGSIRIPAHFCGVYGHKPTYNIVSMKGGKKPWMPVHTDYYTDIDLVVNGPLARSAEDLELTMNLITAPAAGQRGAMTYRLPPSRKTGLKEFKAGVWMDDSLFPPDTEVGNCLEDLVNRLAASGVQIKNKKPDVDLKQNQTLRNRLEMATMSIFQPEKIYNHAVDILKTEDSDENIIGWARSLAVTHRDWIRMDQERAVIRQKWQEYFQEFDVLLCPVVRRAAHRHDTTPIQERTVTFNQGTEKYWDVIGPWNAMSLVAYLPATVAPIGFTPGNLPVGVQIIGPYLEDHTPIQFAKLLEKEITGSFRLPPGFETPSD